MSTQLTREQERALRFPTQAKIDAESKVKTFRTTRKAPLRSSTMIQAIWAGLEELAEVSEITSKDLPALAELWGMNVVTVRCQFYAWRATRQH